MLKFGIVGVGQYGGKLANQFAALKKSDDSLPMPSAEREKLKATLQAQKDAGKSLVWFPTVAVNTTEKDYGGLTNIPSPNRETLKSDLGGAGKEPSVGEELALQAEDNLRRRLKDTFEGIDFIFFVAGLGGGTGTGALPVLVELALEEGKSCGVIATIPATIEDAVVKTNTLKGLESIGMLSADNNVPIILIDNNRIEARVTQENITKADIDYQFVMLLHYFNMFANQESAYRTFDEADYMKMFSIGGVMHLTSVELSVADCVNNTQAPLQALQNEWKNHPFCTIESETAIQAGIIMEVPGYALNDNEKRNRFLNAIDRMQSIVGVGKGNLFAGLYRREKSDKVKVSVMLSGAPLPAARMEQLKKEADAGERDIMDKLDEMKQSVFNLGGARKSVLHEKKNKPEGLSRLARKREAATKKEPGNVVGLRRFSSTDKTSKIGANEESY